MTESVRSIRDLDLYGRHVFMRVDFNVPLRDGVVADDSRIQATLPSIRYILQREGRLVLASHLGRPKGDRKMEFSMEPVGARLAEILDCEVLLTDDCIGDGAQKVIADLHEGQIALLENLRFHSEEEVNDETFARELAHSVDVYVNDAFGVCHRAHASVSALPRFMKNKGVGFLIEKELKSLARLRDNAPRPFVSVLGGAKVSDKIGVIEALIDRVDSLLIGGAMANTFLAARGLSVGKSKIESDKLALARSILESADDRGVKVQLPKDLVVADDLDAESGQVVNIDEVQEQAMALDIGPATVKAFRAQILRANAVFWNGPLGIFEKRPFAEGTFGIAQAVADCRGFTVIGGGDSVAAVNESHLADRFDHVSTGGGASLQFLEGRQLPGLQALKA